MFGDGGEHGLGDEVGEAAAEGAFRLIGKAFGEPFGDEQAEHAVTDEFQALVGAAGAARAAGGGGAVGERLAQQIRPCEAVAEDGLGAVVYGGVVRFGGRVVRAGRARVRVGRGAGGCGAARRVVN